MELHQLQQNIAYKEQGTPYSLTRTITENGQPDILFHWHTDVEIVYVHEGTARFHIDYDYFNSEAGDIILIRPNALHSIHPIGQERHCMDALNFHLDLTGYSTMDAASINYLQPLYNGELDFVRVIKPQQAAYQAIKSCLFAAMEIGYERKEHFEFLLKAQLNQLLYLLFSQGYVTSKEMSLDSYRKEEKIRSLIDYIGEHYQENLTIEHLANYCGYSATHFMNFFKKHLGVSCIEYLIQFRLRKAAELLQHSTISVLEIAQQIGFNNLSNFNRQFKKYYQMTPSQYRKKVS
ncbi:helix-turn-helix transcriptional regulator [Streptococcus massiliensis]|uniref:Putative AraC family transcriptional regulator n=1 Tax=Streptococcus massiliensis TaxID=313439 RepID=A0A380KXI3_9STRE|nr:AraC family transcriptional regulator [Streptococcus massiliensis]SUN76672.1 putative AraC family transcriptional regulator [Streptococcus massiliensis]